MTISVPGGIKNSVTGTLHRRAHLWTVTLKNGLVFRFTDHSHDLLTIYKTRGMFETSSLSRGLNVEVPSMDVRGTYDENAITYEMVRGGLLQNAQAIRSRVDWKYPFLTNLLTETFWFADIEFNKVRWNAVLEGRSRFLDQEVGTTYSRNCQASVGDGLCRLDISGSPYTRTGTVASITTQRLVFDVSGVTNTDNYYDHGYVEFLSGNNTGLKFDVKKSVINGGNSRFTLYAPTSFDIGVGNSVRCVVGCDGRYLTCEDKFSWQDNYKGFKDQPGNARVLKTP